VSHYLIRNETDSDVVLEDVGVRLSGRGATATVEATVFESSSSVKSASGRISFQLVRTPAVWPFSLRRQVAASSPIASIPIASIPIAPAPVASADSSNAEISRKLDGLMSAISSLKPSSGGSERSHSADVTVGAVHGAPKFSAPPADPVFIPGSIVPKDASMNVRLETLETDRPDIDESADALRKLRRKK
jgi:hypothetical protein